MGLLQSNYPSLPLPELTLKHDFSPLCTTVLCILKYPSILTALEHQSTETCNIVQNSGAGAPASDGFISFPLFWNERCHGSHLVLRTLYYSLALTTQFHIYKKHVASTVVTCYYVPPPALYYSLRPTTQYAFTQKLCSPCKRTRIYCSLGRHQIHKKLMTLHIRIQTIHRLTWTLNTRHPNTQY